MFRMVNARLYRWLYKVLCILILLTPLGIGVDVTYYRTVDITYVPSAVKKGAGKYQLSIYRYR